MPGTREVAGRRLTLRVDAGIQAKLDDIRKARGHENTSDAVREAVTFYHSAISEGGGAGATPVVMHLPNAMVRRAEGLVGSADRDVAGVLMQALNCGLRYLLEDAAEQDALARRTGRRRVEDGRDARRSLEAAPEN